MWFQQKFPLPVGGGWSFVLGMRRARGNLLYTRNLVGRDTTDESGMSWLAGTKMRDVQRDLAEKGLTILSVPSYEWVTVGAYIATQGHGMLGVHATQRIVEANARVLDLKTMIQTHDSPECLLSKFGNGPQKARQYLILSVSFANSRAISRINQFIYRETRYLTKHSDAEWLLHKKHLLAVVFIGRERTILIGWRRGSDGKELQSRGGWTFDFRLALFAVQGRFEGNPENGGKWVRPDRAAKLFSYFLYPSFVYSSVLLNIRNYDVFSRDIPILAENVLACSNAMQPVMKKHGSRCELRFIFGAMSFDFFATSEMALLDFLNALYELGVRNISVHPGKCAITEEIAQQAQLTTISQYRMHTQRWSGGRGCRQIQVEDPLKLFS
jgi:hypothetical protein